MHSKYLAVLEILKLRGQLSSCQLTFMIFCALEFDNPDVENFDVMKDIERRISEIEKDLEVNFLFKVCME